MDCVKDFRAVVSGSTGVADTHSDSFEDDESPFVLKSLTIDFLGTNGAVAVLAGVPV